MFKKSINSVIITALIIAGTIKGNAQQKEIVDYNFIYIALSQDDNTSYKKLISELRKLNSVLAITKSKNVLYFTKGFTNFNTDKTDDWEKIYPLINGNSITHLSADLEVENMLKVFDEYEFSSIENGKQIQTKYNSVTWYCFVGSGYWNVENNKNILGILIACCGISNNSSTNFHLEFYHDSDDPIPNFTPEQAIGRYYNFLTDNNSVLIEY